MNNTATAAAASSTTTKLAMAYFSLKLAAFTCVVRACGIPQIVRGILTAARDLRLPAGKTLASVARPDSLYMPEHEAAQGRHGVGGGSEDRRPPPQQLPALAAQDLPQVVEISLDGLDVGVTAVVEGLQVAVGPLKVALEAFLAHVAHELRRLPQ